MNAVFLIVIGWAVVGFLGGSVIGTALNKSGSPIGSVKAFLIAVCWALGWFMGIIVLRIFQSTEFVIRFFPNNFLTVGIIAGIIGGGCTLVIIYRAHASG